MKRMSEIKNGLRFSLFVWAVFYFLSGCTQTEVVDEPQLPKGGKEVQATFHHNVQLPPGPSESHRFYK